VGNPGTLQTSAYVLRREADPEARQNAVGTYFRLVKEPDSEAKRQRFEEAVASMQYAVGSGQGAPDENGKPADRLLPTADCIYRYRQADFDAIPGSPWVYWITPGLRKVFETFPKLGNFAEPVVGLRTSDNLRFLRYWWEAGTSRIGFGCKDAPDAQATGKRWFPYMKGGSFRRWYGNQEYVVNWKDDGREVAHAIMIAYPYLGRPWIGGARYYFRRGVTWSLTSSKGFAGRISPGGFIFDVNGMTCFPRNDDIPKVLGLLNTKVVETLVGFINPTIASQVGDLARLPVPNSSSETLRKLVDKAISLAKSDSEDDETTWDFIAPPDWPDGIQKVAERHARLAEIERQIDEEVYRLYGISEEDRRAIEEEVGSEQYAVGSEEEEEVGRGQYAVGSEEEESNSADCRLTAADLSKAWISYAVGIVMGQFQPGAENGLGRGRFDETTAARLRQLKDVDGLLVVDSAHPDDIAAKVFTALEIMLGEQGSEEVVREALGSNGSPLERLRDYLADKFFKEHTQKYRKRPIYWYLRSAKGNYGLWLYYHRLDKDILFKALLNYVEPKIRLEEDRLKTLRARKEAAGTSGREAKQIEREMDRQEQFVAELHDFKDKLRRAADLHITPDLNDGVVLNIAPLWELVPWKEPKKYWEELQEGKYDWAHIALELWPDRVKEKCRTDRSIAIAHGLEHLCEVSPPKARRAAANAEAPNEDQEESEEEEYADDGAV
jgi:hypothetical protein